MKNIFFGLICFVNIYIGNSQLNPEVYFRPKPEQPGPWVAMSKGAIWPKPRVQVLQNTFLIVNAKKFKMRLSSEAQKCEILLKSISRFERRIFPGDIPRANRQHNKNRNPLISCFDNPDSDGCDPNYRGLLDELTLHLESGEDCSKHPYHEMDENYKIFIDQQNYEKRALVTAKSIWGLLRGLESFSQLIYNTKEHGYQYQINTTFVNDGPRFSYRGVMLDTSRHFLAKKVILMNLDLMEMNKFNVFHWHVTDHPSFPYQSIKFPNLSEYGAFDPETHVYSQKDVADIIEAARIRGIRVIPEFDTPGHTKSWEPGHPGLLTQCQDGNWNPLDLYGPMDPISDSTYQFLREFFDEITRVFPDKYIHIGGDEVDEDSCWPRNREIIQSMQQLNITTFAQLESYFINNLLDILENLSVANGNIVWQEVFDNGDKIRPDTIVHVWKDWGIARWREEVGKITAAGYQAILSAPWYLNSIKTGADWINFYSVEPMSFVGNQNQKKLLIGGEVCLWGEYVNSVNAIPRLWPRGSAVGEKLWSTFLSESDIFQKDILDEAASRLQEHECRMLIRGFPVQPVVGAGYCPVHWEF